MRTLANFEHYNFTLEPALANNPTPLITAQDIVLGADPSNISTGAVTPSSIKVVGIHSGAVLNAGDQFILMQATTMTGTGVGESATGIAQQGISLLYDVQTTVDITGKQVSATILGNDAPPGPGLGPGSAVRVNPQLKALTEGYLSGVMLVTRGADLIADEAVSTINRQNNQRGLAPFVLLSGSQTRYDSGSHIKSKDLLLTGGLSYQQNALTVAAFLEAGWGDYDTHNSFHNAARVRGDGEGRYYGLGVLGRYDFASGLYTDASLRFGQNRNTFDTDIINFTTGQNAKYTLRSRYISAHIGAGYLLALSDKNQLDLSAKYLWTRLAGKSVTVAGDALHFDRINSSRVKVNALLNHRYNDTVTFNAGLGYEHEFEGEADATTYGRYHIDGASVRGGTGVLSFGATVKPTANQNLSFDFKLNGYAGKRNGGGVSIRVSYVF